MEQQLNCTWLRDTLISSLGGLLNFVISTEDSRKKRPTADLRESISDKLLNLPLNTSEMHVWLKCKLLDHVTAKRHQNAQIWSFLNLKERKTVIEQLLHCFVSSKCFRFQFSGPNSLNYSNWLVKLVKLTKIGPLALCLRQGQKKSWSDLPHGEILLKYCYRAAHS